MAFWDTHEVSAGSGYLSPDEKKELVDTEQPFDVIGVRMDAENQFGARYVATLLLPNPETGDEEERLIGFPIGSGATGRDRLLQQMIDDHFGAGETEGIPCVLAMGGRAYVLKPYGVEE